MQIGESLHVARGGKWTSGRRRLGLIVNNAVAGKDYIPAEAPFALVLRSVSDPILVRRNSESVHPAHNNPPSSPADCAGDFNVRGKWIGKHQIGSSDQVLGDILRRSLVSRSATEQPLFIR